MTTHSDGDTGAEAIELFMAEATRVRLSERSGVSRLGLRSGVVVAGELLPATEDRVDGLLVVCSEGRHLLVAIEAVTSIAGASTVLRDEKSLRAAQTLASRLRDCWTSGARLRVLLRNGRWLDGVILLVAADHVEVVVADENWIIPFTSVDVWDVGRPR